MVYSYTKLFYHCICDVCEKFELVDGSSANIYNSAQAVRSIGWSFGRDGIIKCNYCRRKYRGRGFIY